MPQALNANNEGGCVANASPMAWVVSCNMKIDGARPPASAVALSRAVISIILVAFAGAVFGQEPERDLKRFFDTVSAFQARFEQTLLDEDERVLETSEGEMWIVRPGRFRWNYAPPVEQELVSDGSRIWIYDADLEQVTVRAINNTLGRTPAILLAGKTALEEQFDVTPAPSVADNVSMMILKPKDEDAQFTQVTIGFENQVLTTLEFIDTLSQITRIRLTDTVENPRLDPELFKFKVPEGVDVVDETAQ